MKHSKQLLAFLMATALVVTSVSVPTMAKEAGAKTAKVSITKPDGKTLVMKKGKSFKIKTNQKVSFSSSNQKVVSVSSKGKLKALKKGKVTITAKSLANKKNKAKLKVIVGNPVTKVTVNQSNISLVKGQKTKLTAVVAPKNASVKKVSFTSSNEKVATVTKGGEVVAVGEGSCRVTAVSTDGNAKKASCDITVKAPAAPSASVKPSTAVKPSASVAPSTSAKPSSVPSTEVQPSQEPDYYDPQVKYDYQLNNTDASAENFALPSIKDASEYTLKWADNFDGETLNRKDWNVEKHEPGWVNAELQEYVDSEENIFIENGNLVLRPIRRKGEDGQDIITSGRVNTMGKHDFTYGLFEARVKVPKGMGFLPAFWMMPDESIYGQWPKCGEIDIMEIMGQSVDTLHGTIHYGKDSNSGHRQKQGTYKLAEGNFADEYHVFALEWLPGKLIWYVDGEKYYETSDWECITTDGGTVAYPAPFDQPFHVILNLAVGGSWVGYPDETTKINPSAYVIDYVKIFQKDAYDENVTKPEAEVTLRDPDAEGNYIVNGTFAKEDLADEKDWVFMTALNGEATATIDDATMTIDTTKAGDVDYSVQLVQADVPFEKGAGYTVSFDAKASENRKTNVAVKAPDRGYQAYMSEMVSLTTEYQNYSYEFKMKDDSDPNGRLEFNMGNADSTASIYIKNVSIKKTKEADLNEAEERGVREDGNYVYNGLFQEGANRMDYWNISGCEDAKVSVTGLSDGRQLKVEMPETVSGNELVVSQNGLALEENATYFISYDLDNSEDVKVVVSGQEVQNNSRFVATKNQDIQFIFAKEGVYKLDNVRVVEDALIKNGSFNADTAGYAPYIDAGAAATYIVDSQKEDNAFEMTIEDTSDAEWKIQLKQAGVELEENQWYNLSFDIKSSIDRKVQYAIQRDGSVHKNADNSEDWTPYVQDTVALKASSGDYQKVSADFKMAFSTDTGSIFNIAMGAVGGTRITQKHRVTIDNIKLIKIEEPEKEETPQDQNLLTDANFADGWNTWSVYMAKNNYDHVSFPDQKAVFAIATEDIGEEDYHVQLKQGGLDLDAGDYQLKFKAVSTESRVIKTACMDVGNVKWYVSGDPNIALEKGVEKEVVINITIPERDTSAYVAVSMGKNGTTPASTVTLSDFSLVKVK